MPESLQKFIDAITKARLDLLFDSDDSQLGAESEQLMLLALSMAEQAKCYATLAKYSVMQLR